MIFDFDEWVSLASEDAVAFERRRQEAIDALLDREGHSERLVRLQFRIDMERRRSRTALKSCLRLSDLMWQSFLKFDEVLNGQCSATRLRNALAPLAPALPAAKTIVLADRRCRAKRTPALSRQD